VAQATLDRPGLGARRLNLPFWIALAIVIVIYVAAFFALRVVVPQQEIAGTLAALVLGGGAYIQRSIEGRLRQPPGPVVPMSGYQRPWPLVLAGGIAVVWLAQAAVPWIQLRGGPITAVASNIDSVLSILPPAAALLVGVVAGQRSDRYPFVVALAAVGGGWLLSSLTLNLIVASAVGGPPAMPPDALPPGGELPPNPVDFYLGGSGVLGFLLADRLPLLTVAAMAGLWYGTRTRLQAYVGRLLREVSVDDRTAMVELAYESARATQARRESAQQRVGEAAPGERNEQ